jgi:uncharacterized protein (DUF305 family)
MTRALPRAIAAGLMAAALSAAFGGAARAQVAAGPAPHSAGPVRADSGHPPYNAADVSFMSGMIAHHAQAVLMAGWAPSHGAGEAVRGLCARIAVGQTDEIAFMQRWLRERHEPVPDADPAHAHQMPGMDRPMLMPGMLTPAQLAELDGARGREFDRLFLLYMIQHHQGALTMVRELFDAPGALMDDMIFKYSSDVSADQTTEIDRMGRMLAALSSP